MTGRKRWRLPDEPVNEGPACDWRRTDGTIDLFKFRPECLGTPEECAAVTAELDQTISHFRSVLQEFAEAQRTTGVPTAKKLLGSTRRLLSMAKAHRNAVQDRRGQLRRQRNLNKYDAASVRAERRFVLAAKQTLPEKEYLSLWEVANSAGMMTATEEISD